MKHYLNDQQTAKLMELGFEKPKSISGYNQRGPYEYDAETNTKMVVYDDTQYPIYAYSIGELIEMLLSKPHYRVSIYNVGLGQHKVLFKKLINGKFKVLFREVGYEPIDLLFNGIFNLKEEGVI